MIQLLVLWFFVSTSAALAFCALAMMSSEDDWEEGRYERFTAEPVRLSLVKDRPYDYEAETA